MHTFELVVILNFLGVLIAFIFGTLLSGYPIASLGLNLGGGHAAQTIGYDPVRGQFPRFCIAGFCVCVIGTLAVLATPAVSLVAALSFWVWVRCGPPVSHPGGPLTGTKAIHRQPKWHSRDIPLPISVCLQVASKSHKLTQIESDVTLTGVSSEPQTKYFQFESPFVML